MTIDNHSGREHQFGACPASHAEAHSRIALEQSALLTAQLAIARWASAGGAAEPAQMAQADWFATAQHDFQQWLARGGFAQYEDDCADLVTPTMYTLPTTPAQRASNNIPSAAA